MPAMAVGAKRPWILGPDTTWDISSLRQRVHDPARQTGQCLKSIFACSRQARNGFSLPILEPTFTDKDEDYAASFRTPSRKISGTASSK